MSLKSIVALGVIVGALLFWWSHAWALPAGASFTFIETWDEYGTQANFSSVISPYVFNDTDVSSIVCGQSVPWRPTGTGCYLEMNVTGTDHSGENPGPTVATITASTTTNGIGYLGNPSQTFISYHWYRLRQAPGVNMATFLWADSSHLQSVRGLDQSYLQIKDSTGHLQTLTSSGTVIGNSAIALSIGSAKTNWYLFETIIVLGDATATTWDQGSMTTNVYNSVGGRIDTFGCNNCSTVGTVNGSSRTMDEIAFDAEFDHSAIEDFGPTWVINPGNNGTGAFTGPLTVFYRSPITDSSPLQYSVVGVGTHSAAVSNIPPKVTQYVSTATQGSQDTYLASFPTGFGNTVTVLALQTVQESDAVGVRLGKDFLVDVTGTTHGSQCALQTTTYEWCETQYTTGRLPSQIGLELGW